MKYTPEWISFEATRAFSSLSTDYLKQDANLRPFYKHAASGEGIQNAIAERASFPVNRELLVTTLQKQYEGVATTDLVQENIRKLGEENTFTVCTAHQPNIFTGYLYFIYKIAHVIKLAEELGERYPGKNFVPVYYMGSEDNDLDELNHIYLNGDELVWDTDQGGAVGRMRAKGIEKLIEQISGQLGIFEYGADLITLLKACYQPGSSIQQATLQLTDALFRKYGLVVLIPDHPDFKRQMIPVFEDDLFNHTAFSLVKDTAALLSVHYHAQVNPREINLFYMTDHLRERIVEENGRYSINNTEISFSAAEIKEELYNHPERFSPNVVLRGLFQETILPNIVFVGGGSEIAYWLELKKMFEHYKVPYPVILLRNSFLIVNKDMSQLMSKLSIDGPALFEDENSLLSAIVLKNSAQRLSLTEEKQSLFSLYEKTEQSAGAVDATLINHVKALYARASSGIEGLEKKLLRSEKRKYEEQKRQLHKLKSSLFPNGVLQERIENFLPYYARSGGVFIDRIYDNSAGLRQEFGILVESAAQQ